MAYLGVSTEPRTITKERVSIGKCVDGSDVELPVLVTRDWGITLTQDTGEVWALWTSLGCTSGQRSSFRRGLHGDELTGIDMCRRVRGLTVEWLAGSPKSWPRA